MPNRHANTGDYRYGFNGKEMDNELKGEGNHYDYGMRLYDPRVNRFFSTDPMTYSYPYLTPYQFASNRPIDGIDLDGKEWAISTHQVTNPDGTITVTTELVVRVKVENRSTIITDPLVIKAKSEVIKSRIEADGRTTLTYAMDGKDYTKNVSIIIVLDYNPVHPDDGEIGYLIFDDRITTSSSSSTTSGTVTTTTTITSSSSGENIGEVNKFRTSIGITMDGATVSDSEIASTGLHEIFGHSSGLNHPWELSGVEKLLVPNLDQTNSPTRVDADIIDNFMNSNEIDPIEILLTPSGIDNIDGNQIRAIIQNILEKSYYEVDELINKENVNHE